MEKTPSFESKEKPSPITPESVQAEIHARFTNSRELYNHVKEMVDNNHGQIFTEPKNAQEATDAVLHRLASKRRGQTLNFEGFEPDQEATTGDVQQAFKSGALLGLLTASIYYGEATYISKGGEILSEPVNM